jgi:hypothetical protein
MDTKRSPSLRSYLGLRLAGPVVDACYCRSQNIHCAQRTLDMPAVELFPNRTEPRRPAECRIRLQRWWDANGSPPCARLTVEGTEGLSLSEGLGRQ